MSMFLCLESDQKLRGNLLHPNNTAASFTCSLPEHFSLATFGRGCWHLGLVELTLPPIKTGRKWDALYVCCSGCELSCIGQSYRPVVASLSVGEIKRNNFVRFPSVELVPLRVNSLDEVTVEICGKEGEIFQELNTQNPEYTSKCTFILQWRAYTNPQLP